MKNPKPYVRARSFALVLCAALTGLSGWAPSMGQTPEAPSGSAIRRGLPACNIADKAGVVSFNVSNDEPLVGVGVEAKLTLKNNCPQGTADLRVPWEIVVNNTNLATGTESLAPGGTTVILRSWTAVPGTHNFYGSVKLVGDGGNNNTSSDVPVTVMKEITLSHDSVQGSGAQFAHNVQSGPPPDCSRLGQYNASDTALLLNGRGGVVFAAHCGLTGGKADPEAFKNLTLKNGWKVKSAAVAETNQPDRANAGFTQLTLPTAGATNPFTKFHVWANSRGMAYVRVVIIIRGQADKNPFQ